MPVTTVRDLMAPEDVLASIEKARDEIRAELEVLDLALEKNNLEQANDRLVKVWVQANWVRDLSTAYLQARPKTVKARLEFLRTHIHDGHYLKEGAKDRAKTVAALRKPAKKAKATA